jgi:hypothetical protein
VSELMKLTIIGGVFLVIAALMHGGIYTTAASPVGGEGGHGVTYVVNRLTGTVSQECRGFVCGVPEVREDSPTPPTQ